MRPVNDISLGTMLSKIYEIDKKRYRNQVSFFADFFHGYHMEKSEEECMEWVICQSMVSEIMRTRHDLPNDQYQYYAEDDRLRIDIEWYICRAVKTNRQRTIYHVSINHDRTILQAQDMQPETKVIAGCLGQKPLEEILRKSYLERLSDGDLMPEMRAAAEMKQKTIQMNIRIGTRDKDRFDRFCQAGGMNQREGFAVLLDRIKDCTDFPAMSLLLKKREEKIDELKRENSSYKAKLQDCTGDKSQKETILEKRLEFMRMGIQEYLQNLFPESGGKASLPETSWRRYMRNLPENERPTYPEIEGFLVLQPETIVWGNSLHRPCFLVGKGENGKRYLLRCYPRMDFVGFPIRESCYAKPEAIWHVGCQRSRDGAMELMAAFPLFGESGESAPAKRELPETPEKEERKESLEKIIWSARRKQQ